MPATPSAHAHKGHAFNGIKSGKWYIFFTKLFGFTKPFYKRGLGDIARYGPATVLDLGCGPGIFTFALAEQLPAGTIFHGMDIAKDQIRYAQEKTKGFPDKHINFCIGSMDALPFPDASLELVMTSMAMHEAAAEVRPQAIREIARVLQPGGHFLMVDWSKPKFGLVSLIWYPFLKKMRNHDNWRNIYPQWCGENNLALREDSYINSLVRRQVFEKQ